MRRGRRQYQAGWLLRHSIRAISSDGSFVAIQLVDRVNPRMLFCEVVEPEGDVRGSLNRDRRSVQIDKEHTDATEIRSYLSEIGCLREGHEWWHAGIHV